MPPTPPDDVDHLTAIVEIVASHKKLPPPQGVERKQEVARIVVRSDSINSLIDKVCAHLQLMKD